MEKLQIAICDDESIDLENILSAVHSYDKDKSFDISTFSNTEDLLNSISFMSFDIVLLDIEMEPQSGFDAAKKIIERPDSPIIIFVTKTNAFALKGYGIALRYVQKPVNHEELFEALDAAINEAVAHRMTFKIGDVTYALKLRNVSHIEVFGHYAVIHAENQTYRIRSTLKDIVSRLPKTHFASPHNSYVVNLEHIKAATADEVLLDGGVRIPISRRKAQEFNDAFYRFVGR